MSETTTDPCPPPGERCERLQQHEERDATRELELHQEIVAMRTMLTELQPKVQRAIEVCTVVEARYTYLTAQGVDTVAATVAAMRKAEEAKQEVRALAAAAGTEAGHEAAKALQRAQRKLYLAAAAVLVALATAIPALVQHYTGQIQPAVPAASR
jgi:hypothetical protein